MIPVTKPFLPPIEEYENYLKGIWERQHLTNQGPLVLELERKLGEFLGLKDVLFLSNGTIAIQIAIKALGLTGEIITTPFSYVATTSSIVWENCKPVFVDIDKDTFNINPKLIEQAITPKTSAILATHVFGNPCDIDAIQQLADKYDLKVIYDAAHCFGTTYKNKSVFAFGDVVTTSFHATKLFHTTEGGAVFSQNEQIIHTMKYMRNFGHNGPEAFQGLGVNGKNSEFHAAMGLCNLNHIEAIMENRKLQSEIYDDMLQNIPFQKPLLNPESVFNFAYYPVVFETHAIMVKVKGALEKEEIFPRRYFYPSLSSLPYVDTFQTPVSDDIANRILCLPLYHLLKESEQFKISETIKKALV